MVMNPRASDGWAAAGRTVPADPPTHSIASATEMRNGREQRRMDMDLLIMVLV